MFQSGRPQNEWHIIEYDNQCGGAASGAQTAHSDFHVMFDPVNWNSNVVIGRHDKAIAGPLSVQSQLWSLNGTLKWNQTAQVRDIGKNLFVCLILSFFCIWVFFIIVVCH
jgi:hypothetical protein